MFCTACATLNPVAARCCVGCGAGLGDAAERGAPPAAPGGSGRRRRRRTTLTRTLSIVPLVALLVTGAVGTDRYRDDRAALAAAYDRGAEAEAAGRLDEAIVAYGRAGGYRDADARRASVLAALAPYRTAYLEGLAALDAGRFDEAIAFLAPVVRYLPNYEDAAARLAEARARRSEALLARAEDAEIRHDWLAAEAALAELLAENPDDPALQARLEAVRREHAPIVFTRDRQLLMIGPDLGDERLVTDEVPASWPVWSPDRSRIAFIAHAESSDDDSRLYVVNSDGTGLRLLAQQFAAWTPWPAWSPDGTRIAYTSGLPFEGPHGRGLYSVRVVDVETAVETNLTANSLSFAAAPTWSPAGDRLAVIGLVDRAEPSTSIAGVVGADVFVLDLATRAVENVGQGRFPNAVYLTWAPTDDRLLIFGQREQTSRTPAASSIHQLDLTTGAVTNVHVGVQKVMPPVWSPDGSRFAYVEGEGESVIRVRTRGRGEAWINVPGPLFGLLTWSPDGSALLAASFNPKQPSYLIPLDDGLGQEEPVLLVYDVVQPNVGPPVWSPLRPAPVAGPPSVGGSAHDPG
jgi:dipeptidyl aminopeptidase/acylaminoacyl peptidase